MSRPHGLQGGRISQRAELNARDFGPDEEMLQALVCDSWVPPSKLPNLETR